MKTFFRCIRILILLALACAFGRSMLAQPVTSSVSTVQKITATGSLTSSLAVPTGLTLTLTGTVTGSSGVIPSSLVSGVGTVTGITLSLGGALTGSLTNTASVPALTLTLSTFPAASLSGTLFSLYAGGGAIAVTPASTVSLAAGTNVTITRLDNTITLSSVSNSGTVTGFVVTPSNGVRAGVTTSDSVPTLTISLGGITPTSISNSGTLSVSGATTLGSTLVLGGALTGAGATFTNVTNSGAVSGFVLANAAGLQSTTTSIPVASVSGAVTQVTSGNSLIAVTNTTSTPQLTITTSPAFNALTATGAVTLSGVTTPAASTGYVVQINTTSGAISTTTASAGGGGGYSTASASSGLVAASVSATTVSYGSYIFHGITSSASPALNTATLSLAAGSTFTTSGSSVQISSSNSASVLTVSGSPTLSGSGTITYSALPFLAANQTFSGANTYSGTVSLSTLSGTVSLAGQFDGTNGIRIQSTGSTANVLTLKSASQSAARTLTLSIDASATVSIASLLYTNQTQNATLGTITASNVSVTTISSVGGTVNFPLTTINTTDLKAVNTISASTITVGTNLTVTNTIYSQSFLASSISLSGTDLYAPSLASGGGSGDVVYFDTGTGQLTHDSAPSDPRTKDNIAPLGLGLAELRKLADAQGDISFNYKPGFNSQPDLRRGGFNARALADVSPLLAHDRGTLNGVEHVLEPEERAVQAMTVRAVAELSAQVAALRAVVYALIAIMFTYAFILLSTRKNRS
jgi:hypothetical protein